MKQLDKLGRYQIISELGHGEMGLVYKAHDSHLERTVALKTIKLDLTKAEHTEFEARFYREAKAAAKLTHPNIVIVYDAGEIDNIAYIAMEYLEGQTLREIIDSGQQLSVELVIDYAVQVAEGLTYAHHHQIVHRDIKPANVMRLANGVLKITDFGIAQLPTGSLTHSGMVLGSPKYMSPEQVEGKRVDGRSDIFSLGTVLYEMLTKQVPFTGDNVTTMMYKILYVAPEDPRSLNKEVPDILNVILAKCLAKDPAARYQTIGDLVTDLKNYKTATVTAKEAADAFNISSSVGGKLEKIPTQPDFVSQHTDNGSTNTIPVGAPTIVKEVKTRSKRAFIIGSLGMAGIAGYLAFLYAPFSTHSEPEVIAPIKKQSAVPAQRSGILVIPTPTPAPVVTPSKKEPVEPVKKSNKVSTEKPVKKPIPVKKAATKKAPVKETKKSLIEQMKECYRIKDPKCPPRKDNPITPSN